MAGMKPIVRSCALFGGLLAGSLAVQAAEPVFKAGASVVDISPTNFPVLVNAMFTERTSTQTVDRLEARSLALDDGSSRIVLTVVDSCMVNRDLIDRAKRQASAETGIPTSRMMVSSTHTHSAPSAMGCLGSRVDTNYAAFLPGRIAQAIVEANRALVPARIGWTTINDWDHTFTRRWIRRPDRMLQDPFGDRNVRANMHPGYQSPDAIGPSGPVDPGLSILSVQTREGRPLALLANYSQHYYGSPLLSSDYYGKFRLEMARLLGATNAASPFVAIMSQGTSGDQMWMDYGAPQKEIGYEAYAKEIATRVHEAAQGIQYADWAPLRMAQRTLSLRYRTPSPERLEWARKTAATLGERLPQAQPEIYALEAIYLHEKPETELILQAIRIGELGIAAIPNEVYALTGLKLKAQSPLQPTINIELANGAEGYIPTPEQHKLGGYTTWAARTAGLETQAEPRIVETLLGLLEEVSGQERRPLETAHGPYARRVLASRPKAYWRFEEMNVPVARDSSPSAVAGTFEDGVALYLPGPGSGEGVSPNPGLKPSRFSGPGAINRAAHFAGGRMKAKVALGASFSAEVWFWNGLEASARPVTGYFFSRGNPADPEVNGDHLGIGGTHSPLEAGKLIYFNGNKAQQTLAGPTPLSLRTWHHVVLAREGRQVKVYLDGRLEMAGEAEATGPADDVFVGGRSDGFANFEGKLDEAALFDRPLTAEEVAEHWAAAGLPRPEPAVARTDSPPLTPEESLRKIHVPEGYAVELAAAEPLVFDPVAIDWDAAGRLWVVEMADYPLGLDGRGKPGGRIRVLEDTDGDGRYDKSTLFAENLRFPNGLLTWRDGVLVTAAPEVLFLKDSDGDGRADVRQVLCTGFLEGNQQLRVNGLRWGLDNWVYCAAGGHHRGYAAATKIKSMLTGEEIALGSRDFRFDPDNGAFDPQSGPSQFGRNPDNWGHWFGTQNSLPLWHYVLDDRYLRRNAHVPSPDPTHQVIVPRNPKVFPASRQEKRYHSFDEAGHFTSACSGMIYRDELLFPAGETHAFACEPFHNLVHHEVVSDDGVSFAAHRAAGEEASEFFASEDRWCRPVMTRAGPDGALWVVDMYRYMIEHPDWLPANGKAELLPNYRTGDDKGRIYRVVKKGAAARKMPKLAGLPAVELVRQLESPSGWVRDKAQQMLLWSGDKTAVPGLEKVAVEAAPLARAHALWTLQALHVLTPGLVIAALQADSPRLRENALRLAESLTNAEVVAAAAKLADDPDAKVRLQLACSLGRWNLEEAGAALAHLAARDRDDAFMVAAVLSSAVPHARRLSEEMLRQGGPALAAYGESLRMLALGLNDRGMLARLIEPVIQFSEKPSLEQMDEYGSFLQFLGRRNLTSEALVRQNGEDELSGVLRKADGLFSAARRLAADRSRGEAERLIAARLLARSGSNREEGISLLAQLIAPAVDLDRQREAIAALGETGADAAPGLLLKDWNGRGPEVRNAILEQLLRREPWTFALLQQVERGEIPASSLDASRRARLLRHESARVRGSAEKLLASAAKSNRQAVVEQYRPALALQGDAGRGSQIFGKTCVTCHQMEGKGNEIGPDLRSVAEHPPEKILVNILDPSSDVQPGYHAYNARLQNDDEIYGIIAAETANSLVMKLADGTTRTILRKEVASLRSSNLSLMPDGLENGINLQEMADLIAFLKRH